MTHKREFVILVILVLVSILLTAWIPNGRPRFQGKQVVEPYPAPVTVAPYPEPEATKEPKQKPEKYNPKPTEDTGYRPTDAPPDDDV